MGDMAEEFRAWDEFWKERRGKHLAEADPDGWTQHTEWHWSRTVAGKRLDYWPSGTKFRYDNGKVMRGDFKSVMGFIRNREREAAHPTPGTGGNRHVSKFKPTSR